MTLGIIKRAIEEAERSSYKLHLGAVIFKGKRILASGRNELRSSTVKHRKWKNSLHAEIAALTKLDWSTIKGASILVVKVSRTEGFLSNARPCDNCMATLKYVGIKTVYYTNEDGEIICEKLGDNNVSLCIL